jgi:hypothetical protein
MTMDDLGGEQQLPELDRLIRRLNIKSTLNRIDRGNLMDNRADAADTGGNDRRLAIPAADKNPFYQAGSFSSHHFSRLDITAQDFSDEIRMAFHLANMVDLDFHNISLGDFSFILINIRAYL